MFSNKLKKGSVALATVAVVTSMMIGSAFAKTVTFRCSQAGPFDWSSKAIANTTTKHKKGKVERIKPSVDTTTIDMDRKDGKYCGLFRVLGSPIVGSATDENGEVFVTQKISWIGKPSRTELTYVAK